MLNQLLHAAKWPFFLLVLIGFLGVFFLAGCNDCQKLSDYICSCEKTAIGQDSCRKAVAMKTSYKGFDMARNDQICKQVIDPSSGCDCQAIENHDYAKCGMTRQPNDSQP